MALRNADNPFGWNPGVLPSTYFFNAALMVALEGGGLEGWMVEESLFQVQGCERLCFNMADGPSTLWRSDRFSHTFEPGCWGCEGVHHQLRFNAKHITCEQDCLESGVLCSGIERL